MQINKIPFNRSDIQGNELEYIQQVFSNGHISDDGTFTHKCNSLLEKELNVNKFLLTTSCTHALEMAAILLDILPGEEMIIPLFTFVCIGVFFSLLNSKPAPINPTNITASIYYIINI